MQWSIDVSKYDALMPNGTYKAVDWGKSGMSLAIIKASEAMTVDPAFHMQWRAAAGLPRVAYHFLRSSLNAVAQAQFFLSVLTEFTAADYVAVDFETRDGMSAPFCLGEVQAFLAEVSRTVPVDHILLYTYPAFWNGLGGAGASWARLYRLWLAMWPKDNWVLNYSPTIFDNQKLAALKGDVETGVLKPVALAPWSACAIWQFTARADTKAVAGHPAVKKVCDYNAVFMDLQLAIVYKVCPLCGGSGKVPA
jgi:hypothetical protein